MNKSDNLENVLDDYLKKSYENENEDVREVISNKNNEIIEKKITRTIIQDGREILNG